MDVFWTTGAERDREAIFEYVTKENPAAAESRASPLPLKHAAARATP